MKVVQSIEAIYEEQKLINEILHRRVNEIFHLIKKDAWHYLSRIKQLESFALKLETGRVKDPANLEDFLACTLVVENLQQINLAIDIIETRFKIHYKRPSNSEITHKESFSFPFDDLRLYVTLKVDESLPEEKISSVIFEIQIKTFIQHAWGLATHDLIYKADEISWPKERIAFQIKAALEQAELTISGVENLISLPEVSKETTYFKELKDILAFYKNYFKEEDLPRDIIRLCRNTYDLLYNLRIKLADIKKYIEAENAAGRGTNLKNMSPYLLVIYSILKQDKLLIEKYTHSKPDLKLKILIPTEIDIDEFAVNRANVVKFPN